MNPGFSDRHLREASPSRESLWRSPRATHRLILMAAEAQIAIDQGLDSTECFEMNRQYWLQIDQRLKESYQARVRGGDHKRLPLVDRRIVDELDNLKFDFVVGMAGHWHLTDSDQKPLGDYDPGRLISDISHSQPWGQLSPADTNSRLQHRLNLAIHTDDLHLWRDWLVSTGRINPIQVGYENYKHQIATIRDNITSTGEVIAKVRGTGQSGSHGSNQTPIEEHLSFLNRTLASAQGVYTRASQLAA